MKKSFGWLNIITLLYLYIPIIIFLLFWIKPIISLPTLILVSLAFYGVLKSNSKIQGIKINRKFVCYVIIVLLLILCWCIYAGQGGFNHQQGDWAKHNVILNDLINNQWPVKYNLNGQKGVLSYYIGFYLVPALIGKITSFNGAQIALLVWSSLGLLILTLNLYKFYGNNKAKNLFIILFGIIFFGTFIYILGSIYRTWNPNNFNGGFGLDSGEFFSSDLMVQYTTNTTQLCFVFPQMIPAAISTILLMQHLDRIDRWALVCVPLILYSTFTFLGLFILMLLVLMAKVMFSKVKLKNLFKEILSLSNIFLIPLGIVLIMYILCNILQTKPADAGMTFSFVNYLHDPLGLFVMQISWILWVIILYKNEKHNVIMWCASLILFVLPFFQFGACNDFCMRVSIPSLFILNFLVIKNLIKCINNKKEFSWIIIACLLLTGLPAMGQLQGTPFKNILNNHHEYNMPYTKGIDFFNSSDIVKYQYVDWDANNGLAKFIVR